MPHDPQPPMAVFDLDKTITACDTYRIFLRHVLWRRPARWGRLPWLLGAVLLFKSGHRDNGWLKGQFLRHVAGGVPRSAMQHWIEATVEELVRDWLKPGAVQELARHRHAGCRVILATASLDLYVVPLAHRLGIDEVVCTRTDWPARDDSDNPAMFRGVLTSPNCYGAEKLVVLEQYLGKKLATCQAHVYSDHQADLSILSVAGRPFAVDPTRTLQKIARSKGWSVVSWG
ncbi:MAG: HAD-IB family hydrolase [Magnetococcales bacterium]|nr:HAD-IB family hydrolase [Magnetococcales bacterium]MBF0322133.1 HAD-IB family hydrolase [Magnetococcales bacterium]